MTPLEVGNYLRALAKWRQQFLPNEPKVLMQIDCNDRVSMTYDEDDRSILWSMITAEPRSMAGFLKIQRSNLKRIV